MSGGTINPLGSIPHPIPDDEQFKVGGEKLGPKQEKTINIPDGTDPIGYIEKLVSSSAKKESFEKCSDLVIKGSFTKAGEHGPIKAFAYRNPPGRLDIPDCYYFERKWTVEFTDKDDKPVKLTFTKNVYTNVAIPRDTQDINYMQDKEYLATLAASTYSNFVEVALRGRCGGPGAHSQAYQKIKEHINKVQKDNSLNMTFFQGSSAVKQSNLRKGFGLSSHVVTHTRINLRAGKANSQDEVKENAGYVIDLTEKINNKAGEVFSKGQMQRQKRIVLESDDNSSPEIKELAKIQKFLYLENRMNDQGFDNLIDELQSLQINEGQLANYIESKNKRLKADFDDRWNFFVNSKRIETLKKMFGPSSALSGEMKELLEIDEKKMGNVSKFFKKIARKPTSNEGVPNPLRTLLENQDDSLKDERDLLVACYFRALSEMKTLSAEQSRNEEKLLKLATSDAEVKKIQADQAARQKVIEGYEDLFTEFNIDNSILEKIKQKNPPPPPKMPEPIPDTPEPIQDTPEPATGENGLFAETGDMKKMSIGDDEILPLKPPKEEKEKEKEKEKGLD